MSIAPERCQLVFRKLERDLRRLCAQQQAATVHSFRTTVRRCQTLIEEIIPGRNRKHKKLLKLLRRVRRLAGKVRDIDVQLATLRSLKAPQEPRRKTQLMQGLIELRATYEKKLRKRLTRQVARELRKRLRKAAKDVKCETSRDPLLVAHEILSQAVLPAGLPTEDELHRCRLLVKRARYAAEFAPESPAATQFITQVKRLQDALGHWHDWLTLTQTAAEQLGGIHQSSLVAALHNVNRGKFRQAVAALSSSPALETLPKPGSQPMQPARKPRRVSIETPAAA